MQHHQSCGSGAIRETPENKMPSLSSLGFLKGRITLVSQRQAYCLSELLELWTQSQRDLQRLQHRSVLWLLLPAQGLGTSPPHLWPGAPQSEQTSPSPQWPSICHQSCRWRAEPSPGQDLCHHFAVLDPCLGDSHRHQRTLSRADHQLFCGHFITTTTGPLGYHEKAAVSVDTCTCQTIGTDHLIRADRRGQNQLLSCSVVFSREQGDQQLPQG